MIKKKNIIPVALILITIGVIGVIGSTFAYFTSEVRLLNIFKTDSYDTEVTETFESPDDWVPGMTTDKKIVATNKGSVDAAVRISYTEKWLDKDNNTLPLQNEDGISASLINFSQDLDQNWTKRTEEGVTYYYYNSRLKKGESSSSLIESVTFNPEITSNSSCFEDIINHVLICDTNNEYMGGSYILDIKVETVQYDGYKEAWSTSVDID